MIARSLLIVSLCTSIVSAADPEPTRLPPPVDQAPGGAVATEAKAPTTRPTLAQERATFTKSIQEEFSALPEKPETKIGNILSIEIEDRLLVVQSKLQATNGAVKIKATDWPGFLSVAVGDPKLQAFSLKHVDVTRGDWIATYTMISTSIDYLQINRDSESQTEMLSVTLIQDDPTGDEPVRFLVQHVYDNVDKPDTMEKYGARTFEELRQKHPRELRKYLAPILRDLGKASLVRMSDVGTAWQVLGSDIPADPKLEKMLDAILPRLSVDDFAKRTAAQEELAALGPAAATALSRRDLSALGPDPRAAVESFTASLRILPGAEVQAMQKDPDFLLDTLFIEDPRLRRAAIARLEAITKMKIELPDGLKPAEFEEKVEALRARIAPATTQPTTQPAKAPQG